MSTPLKKKLTIAVVSVTMGTAQADINIGVSLCHAN